MSDTTVQSFNVAALQIISMKAELLFDPVLCVTCFDDDCKRYRAEMEVHIVLRKGTHTVVRGVLLQIGARLLHNVIIRPQQTSGNFSIACLQPGSAGAAFAN